MANEYITDWVTVDGKQITEEESRKVLFLPEFQGFVKAFFDRISYQEFGFVSEHYDVSASYGGNLIYCNWKQDEVDKKFEKVHAEKCVIAMQNCFTNQPITIEYQDAFGTEFIRRVKYYGNVVPTLKNYEELKIFIEKSRSAEYGYPREVKWLSEYTNPEKSLEEIKRDMMHSFDLVYFPNTEKQLVRLQGIGPYCLADNGIWYECKDEVYFLSAISQFVIKIPKSFCDEAGYVGIISIRTQGSLCRIKYAINLRKTGDMIYREFMHGDGEEWVDEFKAEEKEFVFRISDYVGAEDYGE